MPAGGIQKRCNATSQLIDVLAQAFAAIILLLDQPQARAECACQQGGAAVAKI